MKLSSLTKEGKKDLNQTLNDEEVDQYKGFNSALNLEVDPEKFDKVARELGYIKSSEIDEKSLWALVLDILIPLLKHCNKDDTVISHGIPNEITKQGCKVIKDYLCKEKKWTKKKKLKLY